MNDQNHTKNKNQIIEHFSLGKTCSSLPPTLKTTLAQYAYRNSTLYDSQFVDSIRTALAT